jgi:hypothetical protein
MIIFKNQREKLLILKTMGEIISFTNHSYKIIIHKYQSISGFMTNIFL